MPPCPEACSCPRKWWEDGEHEVWAPASPLHQNFLWRWDFPLTRWECKGRKRLLQHCTYTLPLHRCHYAAISKPNADCNSKAWRFSLFFTWLFFFPTWRQIKPALMPWEECGNAGGCSNDAVGKVVIDPSKFAFRVWSLHKNPQRAVLSGSGSGNG